MFESSHAYKCKLRGVQVEHVARIAPCKSSKTVKYIIIWLMVLIQKINLWNSPDRIWMGVLMNLKRLMLVFVSSQLEHDLSILLSQSNERYMKAGRFIFQMLVFFLKLFWFKMGWQNTNPVTWDVSMHLSQNFDKKTIID